MRAALIPPTKPGVSYDAVRREIRPLDLMLFRGADPVSHLIQGCERCYLGDGGVSHVGLVVNSEVVGLQPGMQPGTLYIWESTMSGRLTDGVPDIAGRSRLGVQLRELDAVVTAYDADRGTAVMWGRLRDNPCDRELAKVREALRPVFAANHDKPYELNCCQLLAALFPCLRCFPDCLETRHIFCSELVATAYVAVGVLPAVCDPAYVMPADFVAADRDHAVDPARWEVQQVVTVSGTPTYSATYE